jgi:prepilin peptidase CpaA
MIATGLLFAFVAVATATDLARHKIYNWTTYPGMLAALLLNACGELAARSGDSTGELKNWLGYVGLGESVTGLLACGLAMVVCFVLFSIGGGDVKLMAMLGAFLGLYDGIEALLWTFVLGGAFGLILLVWRVGLTTLAVRSLRQIVWSLRIRGWSPLTADERQQLQPPLFLAPSALAALVVMRWLPVSIM